MSKEYELFSTKMEKTYPKIFVGKYGGFAVGAGWYPILEELCSSIQHHIDWKNRRSEVVSQVTVDQIKEKFGGLRFYYQGGDDEISGMVRMAEAWADHSCETCGAPGKKRNGGWIRTLCDKHEEEYQKSKNDSNV
jgi:hypothetical protein